MLSLLFIVLLNFFLAIVVEGYTQVSQSLEESAALGFCTDVKAFVRIIYSHKRRAWPEWPAVLDAFEDCQADLVTAKHLCDSKLFGSAENCEQEAHAFLKHYCALLKRRVVEVAPEDDGRTEDEDSIDQVVKVSEPATFEQAELILKLLRERSNTLVCSEEEKGTCPATSNGAPKPGSNP